MKNEIDTLINIKNKKLKERTLCKFALDIHKKIEDYIQEQCPELKCQFGLYEGIKPETMEKRKLIEKTKEEILKKVLLGKKQLSDFLY